MKQVHDADKNRETPSEPLPPLSMEEVSCGLYFMPSKNKVYLLHTRSHLKAHSFIDLKQGN
jgi:hypothetical protein